MKICRVSALSYCCVIILLNLSLLSSVLADSQRSQIRYRAAQQVAVHDKTFKMNGYRFFGNHTKSNGPVFSLDPNNQRSIITFGTDSITNTKENWYGVFATANTGDIGPSFRLVPFVRVASVNGNTVTFMKAGEGIDNPAQSQSYDWQTPLSGVEILVINETVDNRDNGFSGRTTVVTSYDNTSISLQDIGSIGPKDYLLPAPPGFSHYRYLGSVYMDTEEVRNISDSGALVKAKMIDLGVTNNITGPGLRELQVGGYISPLATAIVIDTTTYLQTTSGGVVAHYFGVDQAHVVQSTYYRKTVSTSDVVVDHGITIPFSFSQRIYLSTGGALEVARDYATFSVTGWVEP